MLLNLRQAKKVYQYIPSSQRRKGDPIFRVLNKSSAKRGTNFPTPLPPLVQHKIEQAKKDSHYQNRNKRSHVAQITLSNKDDNSLPISLYDNRVLYMMQKVRYDTSTGPSLCDGRGQLASFERALSQEQLRLCMKIKL